MSVILGIAGSLKLKHTCINGHIEGLQRLCERMDDRYVVTRLRTAQAIEYLRWARTELAEALADAERIQAADAKKRRAS